MFSLVYVSTATVEFKKPDLEDLLRKSRVNNATLEVTGLLLFKDGNFMQVLEGSEATVNALYKRIAGDSRHSGSMILLTQHSPTRAFEEWSMAFRDLADPDVRALPGFSTFMNQYTQPQDAFRDPTRAQRLLQFFKENMR